jgi:ribose-phosphate pyrophosphokinase
MTRALVIPLRGNDDLAGRIVRGLGAELGQLETRNFPDGETYLRIVTESKGRDVVLVCTLDRPDPKLLPVIFAARTIRQLGAAQVGLVAPYLAYMRQDKRFHEGEAVTSPSSRLFSPQRSTGWSRSTRTFIATSRSTRSIPSRRG